MKESDIRLIQNYLTTEQLYSGLINGKRDTDTNAAVKLALGRRISKLPEGWSDWSSSRKAVAYLQLLCHEQTIDAGTIDGLYGPQTETASYQLKVYYTSGVLPRGFGDIVPIRANPHEFPVENQADLISYYGSPGEISLVQIPCPWRLSLDWDLEKTTSKITIHEKLGDSLTSILEKIYLAYGQNRIKEYGLDRYGGSYNHRKKRGSLFAWSTHAWGIAIDWYPSRNKLKWDHEMASLSHPDLDEWWMIWEEEGWLSLGRTENRDWMHVQAAKR